MVFKISTLTLPIPRTKEDLLVIHGCPLKKFTLRELKLATNNFGINDILGRGGFGTVYRGTLADGSSVAIKRCINMASKPGAELQFQAEMEMGGSPASNHRNVLRLRGYCITPKERLLVYPFMVNRSVHSRLQDRRPESEPPLDWPTRKRIALGAAKGLAHFHNGPSFTVIHRDIKAANILLDDQFEAVICDFGLVKFVGRNGNESTSMPTEEKYEEEDPSEEDEEEEESDDDNLSFTKSCWNFTRTTMRLKEEDDKESRVCTKWSNRGGARVTQVAYHDSYTQYTTAARGTAGHVAPEYLIFGKCSVKSDVFGYGVMLLELVTGQRAHHLARLANDDDATLLDWIKQLLSDHELDLVVDSDLQGDDIQGEIEQMIQLALLCTEEDPEKRPVMTEVIKIIENFGQPRRAGQLSGGEDDSPVQRFSLTQLKLATQDFSSKNIMGWGGSSTVYRGRLQEDGSAVVVKRLGDKSKRGRKQFRAEVKLGGMISGRHPNLLQLRGYCNSGKERLLVYPFMANRSLEWRLRPERSLPLDWHTRKKIALGLAKGVAYLHYHLESNTATHIDRLVKPSNVLLDRDFNPSLSNLRLRSRKSTHVHDDKVGTAVSSVHSDVYEFGMTLLVIVGGNEVSDLLAWAASNRDNNRDRDEELGLHDCLRILSRHGKHLSVDPRLMAGDNNYDGLMDIKDEVEQLMQVALLCTQPFVLVRPEMSEVIKMIEAISRGGLNVCSAFDRGNLFQYNSTPTEPPQLPHELELGDIHSPPLDTDGSDQESHQIVPESVPQLDAENSSHLLDIPKQGGMLICDHVEEPAMQDRWKVFLYEVVSDALTTKSKLWRSGMSLDPLCPLCNVSEENILHLFFKCDFSNRVWESAVGMRMDMLGFGSVKEAVDAILRPRAAKISIPWDGEASLFSHKGVAIMYSIWTHRNEVCFDKVSPNVMEVVSLSRKYFPEHLI